VKSFYKFFSVLFFFASLAMSAPSISSPADGSEIIKGKYDVLFSFANTSGGVKVQLYLDNNPGFGSPEIGFNNGSGTPWVSDGIVSVGSSFNLTKAMQNKLSQNVYFAKAVLLNASNNSIGESAVIKISLLNWLSSPTINSPKDGVEIVRKEAVISFSISNADNANKMEVWVDNNSGWGSPEVGFDNGQGAPYLNDGIVLVSSGFSLSISDQNKLPQNKYFAKVRLLTSNNMPVSDWSSMVDFVLVDEGQEEECLFNPLSIDQINVGYFEEVGSVNFKIDDGCNWTVSSNQSWIQITSGSSGTGDGSFSYKIEANTSATPRAGVTTLESADDKKTISVSQEGSAILKTKPIATIVSITPETSQSGGKVDMVGAGYDEDGGDVFDYEWKSNLMASVLSGEKEFSISVLKVGEHIITLKVTDDEGVSSELASKVTKVEKPVFAKCFDAITGFKTTLGTKFVNDLDASGKVIVYRECPYYVRLETGATITGDGGTWFNTAKSLNYPTGSFPIVGAIIIIQAGSSGHVGMVADIKDDIITIRDANWDTLKNIAIVKEHKMTLKDNKLNGYTVAGYIYHGTVIPESGGNTGGNSLANKSPFSVDIFVTTSEVEEVVDTSLYGVKKAVAKDVFKVGDSIIFFSQNLYVRDSIICNLNVKKDGVDYQSYSDTFNTEGILFPHYYQIYGSKFDEIGSYSCSFKAISGGKEFNFSRNFIVDSPVSLKLKPSIMASSFSRKMNKMSFYLDKNGSVEISLLDCRGRSIWNKSGDYTKGKHSFSLNNISAGVYLLNFKANSLKKVIKVNFK